jgi:protein phosphatase PTC1
VADPVAASKALVDHALARFSTDNLSCMIVRFNKLALIDTHTNKTAAIGVEGDIALGTGKISEVDRIVATAKRKVEAGGDGTGISGSNSGKGHDPVASDSQQSERKSMEKVVEEDPTLVDAEATNELAPKEPPAHATDRIGASSSMGGPA